MFVFWYNEATIEGGLVMKDTLLKLCNNVHFNTYRNLEEFFLCSGAGLAIVSSFSSLQEKMLDKPVGFLGLGLMFCGAVIFTSQVESYTKEVCLIRERYQEFIQNYNQLNAKMELHDPIAIHTMFQYLLDNGYLSRNCWYRGGDTHVRDIANLEGVDIIHGEGVCRHQAAMLTDILRDYGIFSHVLCTYLPNYVVQVDVLPEQKYTKEELIEWIQTHVKSEWERGVNYAKVSILMDDLHQNIELSYQKNPKNRLLHRMTIGHAITFAHQDGKNYFLDPTQGRIYRMSEEKSNELCDDDFHLSCQLSRTGEKYSSEFYKELKKKILERYPSPSKEEEDSIVKETTNLCENNIDIFRQFYRENHELYHDIANQVLSLKQKKLVRRLYRS